MTTTDAYMRGAKRAMQIISAPDPRQIKLNTARKPDPVEEAWKMTGDAIRTSIHSMGKTLGKQN